MRNRQLQAVVIARFVSLTGTNMTIVALPWFVLATTGSTAKMGLVLACQTLPGVILGVPGGAVVAALGPRGAFVAGDVLRAPLLVLMPLLYLVGALPFVALLLLGALIGIFTVPYSAAMSALLPELVGDDEKEVTRAQSALQVAAQVTGILGPAAAGALIPLIGSSRLLYLDAASYAISAAVLLTFVGVRKGQPATAAKQGMLAGLRFILTDSLLSSILTGSLIVHVAFAALMASLPVLAFREFHDARVAGTLLTAVAAGSITGGILAMRLATRMRPLTLGCAGFTATAAPLWLLVGPRPFLLVGAVAVSFGLGSQLGISPVTAVLTTRAPAAIRSHAISAFLAITNAGVPIGSALTGVAIATTGFSLTYTTIATLMSAAALLLIWNVRRLPGSSNQRIARDCNLPPAVKRMPSALTTSTGLRLSSRSSRWKSGRGLPSEPSTR